MKPYQLLLALVCAFAVFILALLGIFITGWTTIFYSLFCVAVGVIGSWDEDDLVHSLALNEIIIVILMAITRTATFIMAGGFTDVPLGVLNIVLAFAVYTLISGITTFVIYTTRK